MSLQLRFMFCVIYILNRIWNNPKHELNWNLEYDLLKEMEDRNVPNR